MALTDDHLLAAYSTAVALHPLSCEAWIIREPLPAGVNGAARREACTVLLSTGWTSWDYPKLCTIIVHEFGHLAGLGHVDDPAHYMHPTYVGPMAPCAVEPPLRPEGRIVPQRRPRTPTGWVRLRQREYDYARKRIALWQRLDATDRVAAWRADRARALRGKRFWQARQRASGRT